MAEGFYRVQEPFTCCEKRCRLYDADLLVQLGYDSGAQPLLFVPEWADAGLAISEIGLRIAEGRLVRLAPLKVVETPRESQKLH